MNFPQFESRFAAVSSPTQTVPVSAAVSFVLCPVMIGTQTAWASELYRIAYERAREAVERPWFERLLAPSAN